ncbi:MAG TPA: glycosyltransferase family 39 protein [Planctomycetaceae bacterium]
MPCILAGALAARLGTAVLVQQKVEQTPGRLCLIAGDAAGYWDLARHLARGEDFAIYDPPRYVLRMPGFPIVMALGMKVFGESVLGTRVMLACVGTVACWLVYLLGRELVDENTGLIAGFLAAISPALIGFSVLLLSETLFALALLASLIAFAKLVKADDEAAGVVSKQRRVILAIFAGVLFGAATLVRPTWLLVAPAFALFFLLTARNRKRRLSEFALVIAGLSLALAPWTIRNALVTGHFVPTTLWMGPSLYDGLSPQATGESKMEFVETDGWYSRPDVTEYEADRHYRQAALAFAKDHPGRACLLGLKKLWRFCNPFPNAEQFGDWGTWLVVGLFELPVLLLGVIGFWQVRNSPRTWVLSAGPVLYFALVHTVFIGSLRYRLPVEYALLVLSAVGARWLVTKFTSSRQIVPGHALLGSN